MVKTLKIIFLGDSGVGKTAILNRYVNENFVSEHSTTIAVDLYLKTTFANLEKIYLQIWDTAGQERFNALTKSYFRGADCVVLVYDSSNRKSFENLSIWKQKFLEQNSTIGCILPLVVIGNKTDLENVDVPFKEAEFWANNNDYPIFQTSAKSGSGINEAFFEIVKLAMERKDMLAIDEAISAIEEDSCDSKGCC